MLSYEQTADRFEEPTPDWKLGELDRVIAGAVVGPNDENWDLARQAWALAVDQQPVAVALPHSADDIVAIVDFARERGLRVAPQTTGHSAHTLEHVLQDSILIKTERMRGVEIDPVNRRARIEAGAIWIDVTVPAAEHGLAALAGSSPDVGVVGYTLGGCLSWLSRRHGLAANSVVAIELVTADGRRVRADRDHHADMFWALRGGGGSFGVVTAIEIELLPIANVYAGAMFWPQERAGEVLQAWREWTQGELPDEIMSVGRVLNVPPFPDVPEPLRGRSFVVVEAIYIGEEADGAELIAPLRALEPEIDTFATIPAPTLSHLHMDPEHPVPGKGDGMLLSELPAEAIHALVRATTGGAGAALLSAEVRHLGGAIARPAPEHGALDAIAAPYAMFAVGAAPTADLRAVVEQQVDGVKQSLAPWSAGYRYLNFAARATPRRCTETSTPTTACRRSRRSTTQRTSSSPITRSSRPVDGSSRFAEPHRGGGALRPPPRGFRRPWPVVRHNGDRMSTTVLIVDDHGVGVNRLNG